ncbi:plasmid partitioning protein RepB [Marivita hallyeonensis]|nr:plasmid partitioning protein RepB [Marivita hallyeonensis]
MAAITAANEVSKTGGQGRAQPSLPKGTIGSVRAGLGGIQDVDTDKILSWGPQDRLELTAVNSGDEDVQDLRDSIRLSGQQVPVLLRPSPNRDGHFEVIYGRRRILACHQIGIPVKALIRTLDDSDALMAKGLENASRADLSYYERARFAKASLAMGHDRAEVIQALAISKNTLSQMERVTRLVPDAVGDAIGAAPKSGRPKWMALAAAFEAKSMTDRQASAIFEALDDDAPSDVRLEALLDHIAKRGRQERAPAKERSPVSGVQIKSTGSAVALSVRKTGDTAAFAEWLDGQLDTMIETAFVRFEKETRKE